MKRTHKLRARLLSAGLSLALLTTLLPGALAASYPEVYYEIDSDEEQYLYLEDFEDACLDEKGDEIEYIRFTDLPDKDDGVLYDDYEDEPVEEQPPAPRSTRRSTQPEPAFSTPTPLESRRDGSRVVNISTTAQLQVVLVKPERFDNVSEIADHLRDKHAVLLNLENTDKSIARRLVDFLSGCAYAVDGKIKKVAASAYLITPFNVEIVGDLVEELENNGMYF